MLKIKSVKADLGAREMNKVFYKKQAEKHFKLYEKALESGDKKATDYHMKEFLTYDRESK